MTSIQTNQNLKSTCIPFDQIEPGTDLEPWTNRSSRVDCEPVSESFDYELEPILKPIKIKAPVDKYNRLGKIIDQLYSQIDTKRFKYSKAQSKHHKAQSKHPKTLKNALQKTSIAENIDRRAKNRSRYDAKITALNGMSVDIVPRPGNGRFGAIPVRPEYKYWVKPVDVGPVDVGPVDVGPVEVGPDDVELVLVEPSKTQFFGVDISKMDLCNSVSIPHLINDRSSCTMREMLKLMGLAFITTELVTKIGLCVDRDLPNNPDRKKVHVVRDGIIMHEFEYPFYELKNLYEVIREWIFEMYI
jgi:hypothetical protein